MPNSVPGTPFSSSELHFPVYRGPLLTFSVTSAEAASLLDGVACHLPACAGKWGTFLRALEPAAEQEFKAGLLPSFVNSAGRLSRSLLEGQAHPGSTLLQEAPLCLCWSLYIALHCPRLHCTTPGCALCSVLPVSFFSACLLHLEQPLAEWELSVWVNSRHE
jgi:hypothetical protein